MIVACGCALSLPMMLIVARMLSDVLFMVRGSDPVIPVSITLLILAIASAQYP